MTARRVFALLAALLLLTGLAAAEEYPILIKSGGSYCFVRDTKGTLWCWGDNRRGQLGQPSATPYHRPLKAAEEIPGTALADVQCGNENTLFLMTDGTVWTVGANNYGQQGIPEQKYNSKVPKQIPGLTDVVQVATGYGQCLARTADGHVWAWGRNSDGQCGIGQIRDKGSLRAPELTPLENIVHVVCGGKYCFAIAADGTVYGWGDNSNGILLGLKGKKIASPTPIPELTGRFTGIYCGGSTAYGLDSEGHVWAWGKNDYMQAGQKSRPTTIEAPSRVTIPDDVRVEKVFAYNAHVAVITDEGKLWQWGRTSSGQLGNGSRKTKSLPTECPVPGDEKVTLATTGSLYSAILTESGKVYTAGYSEWGQSGAYGKKMGFVAKWAWTGLNLVEGTFEIPKN